MDVYSIKSSHSTSYPSSTLA